MDDNDFCCANKIIISGNSATVLRGVFNPKAFVRLCLINMNHLLLFYCARLVFREFFYSAEAGKFMGLAMIYLVQAKSNSSDCFVT